MSQISALPTRNLQVSRPDGQHYQFDDLPAPREGLLLDGAARLGNLVLVFYRVPDCPPLVEDESVRGELWLHVYIDWLFAP